MTSPAGCISRTNGNANTDQRWAAAVRALQWHLYSRDVEPCREELLAYCRSLTRDRLAADDLVQETLLRGFGVVSQLCRGMDRPIAFLRRVALNLWIDSCRSSRGALSAISNLPEGCEGHGARHWEVNQALSRLPQVLPPRELEVYVLRELQGYSGSEVSELLAISLGATKMALGRARRRLRGVAGSA